jgi:hypothetical protein
VLSTVYHYLQTPDIVYLMAKGNAIFLTQMFDQINEPGTIVHGNSRLANGS